MSLVVETRHLWIGVVTLLALAASADTRGAAWLNLASVHFHRAVLDAGPSADAQVQRALDLDDRAIAADPANSRALVLAATIQAARGGTQAAIALLERAVALEPANVGVRLQLANAHLSAGSEDVALAHWREAGTWAVPMLLKKGDIASAAGDITGAMAYYERATRVDPAANGPWIALGTAFEGMGRFEEARVAYGRAVEQQPGQTAGYERLAALLIDHINRPAEADAVVADGMARVRSPGPGLYLLRSRRAADLGDYHAAERDARQAIALNPRHGTYLAWLGELYYRQGRYAEAVAQYARTGGEADEPNWRWRSHRRIGQTYAALQNWSAAVEAYRTAVAVSRAQGASAQVLSQNHLALGEALRDAGDIEMARAEFTRAIAEDPANERAARLLAALRNP